MSNINNDFNNYEIELSENFMKEKNNKDFPDYSLIPSNYGKISNSDFIQESNNNNKNKNKYNKIL